MADKIISVYVIFCQFNEKKRRLDCTPSVFCISNILEKVFYENESTFFHPEIYLKLFDMNHFLLSEFKPPTIINHSNYLGISINESGVHIVEKSYSRNDYMTSIQLSASVVDIKQMLMRARTLQSTGICVRNWYDVVWLPASDNDNNYLCPRFVAELLQYIGYLKNVKTGAIQADNIYQLLLPHAKSFGQMVTGHI